jgi:hypothetical protein
MVGLSFAETGNTKQTDEKGLHPNNCMDLVRLLVRKSILTKIMVDCEKVRL